MTDGLMSTGTANQAGIENTAPAKSMYLNATIDQRKSRYAPTMKMQAQQSTV
jgi:hypothetical protein